MEAPTSPVRHPARVLPFDELLAGLHDAVASGLVFERQGPGWLRLYGYTQECVYNARWTPITTMARGLILDVEARAVVATPFPKFFNHGERPDQVIPDEPFEVFEKLDGSLIILFHHEGRWRAATRGSFTSEQAQWAQRWLDARDLSDLSPGTTYLCECLYPENRIVVRYDREGLELLGAYDSDGEEWGYHELSDLGVALGWRVARRESFLSLTSLLAHTHTLPASEEGFVVRFANGYRLKFKGEEYRRLHAMVSRVTPLGVWEMMRAGDDLDAVRRELPEEFWADFDAIVGLLEDTLATVLGRVAVRAWRWRHLADKDIGLRLGELPPEVRKFIFSQRRGSGRLLEDDKSRDGLWRAIRPTGNTLPGYDPSRAMARLADAG